MPIVKLDKQNVLEPIRLSDAPAYEIWEGIDEVLYFRDNSGNVMFINDDGHIIGLTVGQFKIKVLRKVSDPIVVVH